MSDSVDLIPLPSQTVGPYFEIGLVGPRSISRLISENTKGEKITLVFTVYDGNGEAVDDAMIEIWQANTDGRYNHPADTQGKPVDPEFSGFGRMGTDVNGVCAFETVKPGRVPGPHGKLQAPHLAVSVFARGLLRRIPTRVYFAGDPANDEDPVLVLVPEERRETLMAHPAPAQPGAWRFDVHLCGDRETVFFDI